MEITYTLVGDYYRPNLVAPESPKVGRWGMLRFNYLRKHQEALYTIMLMENTLNHHLEEIDRQAQEMEQQLISQLAQRGRYREDESGKSNGMGCPDEQHSESGRRNCFERTD